MGKVADRWNPTLYDMKHSFVSKYGDGLVELLAPNRGEKILDLGCGTGDLAKKLDDYGVDVTGIDISENMVLQAQKKYPGIKFLVQDATKLDYNGEFNAVLSNATLHWVKPADQALRSIYRSLKKGGRFAAEFGGKGNVQTIANGIIQQIIEAGFEFDDEQFPWYYPSIAEYTTIMEEAGFRVTFAQHFDRPTQLTGEDGLKNWIEMFGGHFFGIMPIDEVDTIISKVENQLKKAIYKDGSWIADYKRIRVIGIKE